MLNDFSYRMFRADKSIETECRPVVARGREERRMGSAYLISTSFPLEMMECSRLLNNGDGCNTS